MPITMRLMYGLAVAPVLLNAPIWAIWAGSGSS